MVDTDEARKPPLAILLIVGRHLKQEEDCF